MSDQLRYCRDEDVIAAVEVLAGSKRIVRASEWRKGSSGFNFPGLYAWWVDADGARDLSEGVGYVVHEGLIYTGQAGATTWPSGKTSRATLQSRISSNHVNGNTRSSTFRKTLASLLMNRLGFDVQGSGRIDRAGEHKVTTWIEKHLGVSLFAYLNREQLRALEERVLALLDPPLNLSGMTSSAARVRLAALRCHGKSESVPSSHSVELDAAPVISVSIHSSPLGLSLVPDQSATTQRITAADLAAGRIRIPGSGKGLFPMSRARIDVTLRSRQLNVGWDPRMGPDRERSGVLSIGIQLRSMVAENEILRVRMCSDGTVSLG